MAGSGGSGDDLRWRVFISHTSELQAFTHAQAITSAAGVTADTQRLLEMIATHDRTGVLTELSAAKDL